MLDQTVVSVGPYTFHAERLSFAFRRVTARKPTEAEAKVLAGALEKQRTLFAADKGADRAARDAL